VPFYKRRSGVKTLHFQHEVSHCRFRDDGQIAAGYDRQRDARDFKIQDGLGAGVAAQPIGLLRRACMTRDLEVNDQPEELVELDRRVTEHAPHVEHTQAPYLEAILQRFRASAIDYFRGDLGELRRIVRDQAVTAIEQFQGKFALAAARSAGDQHTDCKDFHENAMQSGSARQAAGYVILEVIDQFVGPQRGTHQRAGLRSGFGENRTGHIEAVGHDNRQRTIGKHPLCGDLQFFRIQAVQIGNWPAPYGITLVADLFSSIMLTLTGIIGLAVAVYSLGNIDPKRENYGYHTLLHILLLGISGAFLTGDMFNLYVWFEVMLIASFVLMALGGERAQMEGALKYVTLNLMSSAIFLAALGILYGVAGTLNMADLATQFPNINSGLVNTLAMMFLVAFGIKAAIFPLFFWLPAAYHTPPAAVSAIFAGLLTKVGVYALIRVFTLLFIQDVLFTHQIILLIAGFTMVSGVLGAASQFEFRRILSFHIISQIGYMIFGLALFSPAALAGAVFYIIHHIIVKANLFLISGAVNRLQGSYQLKELGGLYRSKLSLAVLFLIPALSLAGLPPLSGFWAKFTIMAAGLDQKEYTIVAVALGVSLLTLYSMFKIWNEVFWKAAPVDNNHSNNMAPSRQSWILTIAPILVLAIFTLVIGLAAEPFLRLSQQAAAQLLDPIQYIQTVLGEQL